MTNNNYALRIVAAQLNFVVGDISANAAKIIAATLEARDKLQADLIVFPELALSGYPADDLLLNPDFIRQIDPALREIAESIPGIAAIIGTPLHTAHGLVNAALFINNQQINGYYCKQFLSQQRWFREVDYFTPGTAPHSIEIDGIQLTLSIGAEILQPQWTVASGSQLVLNLGAIPYAVAEHQHCLNMLIKRHYNVPFLQVNHVGGQDELVFAGHSLLLSADAKLLQRAAFFREELCVVDFPNNGTQLLPMYGALAAEPGLEAGIYQALLLGLRDYVEKNRFPGAILGLSGGLDSALTLALAVDALGAERVEAVLMPSRYTAQISNLDAEQQAQMLGVRHHLLPIEPAFQTFLDLLQPLFAGRPLDATEENLQARCRGVLLMGIANKTGKILLATSNKSEIAVGYSTLYGDMAGGFAPLKDVLKTMVYRLANWRNQQSPAIPQRVIDRPPSAELRPNQTDQDSLPPYELLDAIVCGYVEEGRSVAELQAAGYDPSVVQQVVRLVLGNVYKHRQVASGVRISQHPFGRERRYPLGAKIEQF